MLILDSVLSIFSHILPLESFEPRFVRLALLALLLLAPTAATIGVQVVNHRLSFFSDAIGHSAFAGVALGVLMGVSPRIAMVAFGVLVGLLIMRLQQKGRLASDTAIGVVFSAIVAFGLAIVSREPGLNNMLQQFLYGDILTIEETDIVFLSLLAAANLVLQVFGYNSMVFCGFNDSLASAHGTRVVWWQNTLAVFVAGVVAFSVWAVGVLLVSALLVIPAAAARNFARSAAGMFWWAPVIATTSGVVGLFISMQDWAGTATGATVILCSLVWFLFSVLYSSFRRARVTA
jgi:zinc transport system permease protein